MESPIAYLPMDRRQALARGAALPERSTGAALFADISGFTPLVEALVRALGPQRGAEELPRQLNLVYDALVAEVDRFGGSVLGFAGDAITCWFDDRGPEGRGEPGGPRAAACGLALQRAMAAFASVSIPGAGVVSLAIKVGIASGPVRRFLVGDPAIQTIDVLAGDTLQRMTAAEHSAAKGDVLIDAATAAALGERAAIAEWRADEETGERFAVLRGLGGPEPEAPWPPLADEALPEAVWRAWLLPPIYERLRAGMGAFLTEMRPICALFLRFGGIDYDHDPLAQEKLDAFVLWVQRILRAYDAYVLQLTIGDKGSFLYAAFGAPVAHEDDAVRAVMAALELREPRLPYLDPVQLGLSQGRGRTGAYGGITRRTYGALADDVNTAARLMQKAGPGEVLVGEGVRRATGDRFVWDALPPFLVKGKSRPLTAFRLVGQDRSTIRLHQPRYALPMVGREPELAFVLGQLDAVGGGRGQIVGVSAEAGLGKSRLVAEVLRHAWGRGVRVYGGDCQSYGTTTPYLVWQDICRACLGVDASAPPDEQVGAARVALARLDPALLPRLPLLGAVLNLSIPDTPLTASFDAQLRKRSLEAMVVGILAARAAELPLLLVLEDCHWIDPLSHDLLEAVGRAAAAMPVLILLAYRPPQAPLLAELSVARLAHFRELALDSLMPDEVRALVRLKLGQIVGDVEAVPDELLDRVNARAQGNPFYIEELLNYVRDQGLDPRSPADLARLDLPPSLHSLILSRIDRLSESQKSLIKVASVIGRLFRASILWGVSAFFGQQERIRSELEELSALELTPLDSPEPELTYLFKHIVTQEVTYESMPYATRAVLHEQIAQHLERATVGREQLVDLLAFHYDRSENTPKRREYLLRAGAAAQAIFANVAAVDYYRRALPLLDGAERARTLLQIGQVQDLVGALADATASFEEALALAAGDPQLEAQVQVAAGELLRRQGEYDAAAARYGRARAQFEAAGDRSGLAKTISCEASLAWHQSKLAEARAGFARCLAIRRELGQRVDEAKALSNLGVIAWMEGDLDAARGLYEESLAIQRAEQNLWSVAATLNNLALLALDQADPAAARAHAEEATALLREIGDKWSLASSLHALGTVVRDQGDLAAAAACYVEGLRISLALGDRFVLAYLLEDTGVLAAQAGQPARALRLASTAAALRAAIGTPRTAAEQSKLDSGLAPARAALTPAEAAAAEAQGQALDLAAAVEDAVAV